MVAIGLIIFSMPRRVLAAICAVVLCSCGYGLFEPPSATPAPFCAPFAEPLGSVQLDYTITPPATLAVSAADAEREARARMGAADGVSTCSVRLARYDNLSEHLAAVWVVQLDGLSMEALGGDLLASPPRSPHILRRAIVLITTDAPAKPVLSIATGP